jgi:putative ABC transport system ATP-binding protein
MSDSAAERAEPDSALIARDIWKQYQLGDVTVDALRGINITLPAGRFVVLVGPSGSGKTTLLNLAGGLDVPTRGELTVFGQALNEMHEQELTAYRRRAVGFVFQMFNLVPTLTALENVRLVAQLVGKDELSRQALSDVGLDAVSDHLPSQLSGGEQQRVAIARALVKQPNLLLADEPTGALDFETGRQVLSVLWEHTRSLDMTVIMVTHNIALARTGDIVVRLRSGEVVEIEPGEAIHPTEITP